MEGDRGEIGPSRGERSPSGAPRSSSRAELPSEIVPRCGGAAEMAIANRAAEGVEIHDLAAGVVDQHRPGLHAGEFGHAEQTGELSLTNGG